VRADYSFYSVIPRPHLADDRGIDEGHHYRIIKFSTSTFPSLIVTVPLIVVYEGLPIKSGSYPPCSSIDTF
jgi:hypothetical protein